MGTSHFNDTTNKDEWQDAAGGVPAIFISMFCTAALFDCGLGMYLGATPRCLSVSLPVRLIIDQVTLSVQV